MDAKVGDVVLVRAKIQSFSDDRRDFWGVRADGFGTGWFETSAIVSTEPRPLQVGDTVKLRRSDETGDVIGVAGVWVWVRWPRGPQTYTHDQLERA
jgi:hypothetical protein